MNVLVQGVRVQGEVDGNGERICSTDSQGVVSPAGRQAMEVAVPPAEIKPGQLESHPSSFIETPASSSGADETAVNEATAFPAADGESEWNGLHGDETHQGHAEGDGCGDANTVGPKPTMLDDAAAAKPINQSEGDEAVGAPSQLPSFKPVSLPENRGTKLQHGGVPRVIGAAAASASANGDETSSGSSNDGDTAADERAVPQLSKQALESLLDESTGKLVALEDFECKVDDRARENEWLGRHTPISLAVFQEELHRTGKYTFNVDENGVLLDDPVKFPLAREAGAQITLRVHHGLNEAKKSNFILLAQGRDRERTEAENRELKRRIILAALLQGLTYEATAELAGVHPNTARNVEKRAAADPNSKLGITQPPDRRYAPETREKIAKAAELRKEGKSNAEIAEIFGTDVETVGKLFKDRPARDKAKGGKGKKKTPARRKEPIEDIAADERDSELYRRAVEWLDLDAEECARLDADCREQAREEIEKVFTNNAELLRYAVYGKYLRDFAHELLEERCGAGADEGVDEEAAGASSPDAGGYEADQEFDGTVQLVEPDVAPVSLPAGDRGAIAEVDTGGARLAVAEKGDEARARVNGFDPEAGHSDRESVAQDDRTRAAEPNLDDRASPYEKHFGRKGESRK